jgi:excisionase family DNA binding protein
VSEPLVVSVREGARRLGLGRDTAYRLVREGRLRSLSVGRKILIPVRELEAFVEREAQGEDAGGAA